MSNYSENPAMCRVDVFKVNPTGKPYKWNLTEAVDFSGAYDMLLTDAIPMVLRRHFQGRCAGQIAVITEPYSRYSFPWIGRVPE